MAAQLPPITGKQLIRLFEKDGWTRGRRTLHGVAFRKSFPDGRTRVITIPDKRSVLPDGTLGAILGPKQSGIGRAGLAALVARHGIHQAGSRAIWRNDNGLMLWDTLGGAKGPCLPVHRPGRVSVAWWRLILG
jgi:predicted RNA binding protein YcfA (HicA-like mRNA interferase family)